MIKVKKTKLNGVLEITPSTNFHDFRGKYIEIYNKKYFFEKGIKVNFIQDDVSISNKNVLRGIHGDEKTWKLISCLYGSFYLVIVNNDKNSSQYKKWISFTLTDNDCKQILIPPKFGNGHLVLSDRSIFHYKQNTMYNRKKQFTIKWNDKDINIFWPIKNPITSLRDK